jgi:hypothetical protein
VPENHPECVSIPRLKLVLSLLGGLNFEKTGWFHTFTICIHHFAERVVSPRDVEHRNPSFREVLRRKGGDDILPVIISNWKPF